MILNKKNNLKLHKYTFFLIIFLLILSISIPIYAKYKLEKSFNINANSAEFYFDITSKEADDKIKFEDNKAEFDLLIKNNNGTNYNVFDTSYEIILFGNDKYTFSVGNQNASDGTLVQTLKGNELLDENKVITIIPKENASLKLAETLEIKIKVTSPYIKEYNFPLTIVENKEFAYDYSGTTDTFTAPITGKYKVELWGAEGGTYSGTITDGTTVNIPSSKGAYTSGIIDLTKNEQLNLTIGGKGTFAADSETITAGGFNGGGGTYYKAGTGGGATDIRYGGTTLNDRIMVAAGAGGSAARANSLIGGAGGTFVGLDGGNAATEDFPGMHAGRGGTQIAGGLQGELWTGEIRENRYPGTDGSFGSGGKGGYELSYLEGAGAGGGGYYGGGGGAERNGGGGRRFIFYLWTCWLYCYNFCNRYNATDKYIKYKYRCFIFIPL